MAGKLRLFGSDLAAYLFWKYEKMLFDKLTVKPKAAKVRLLR
jgi:hypothetical protein